jgi:hypothetical protein
MKGEGNHVKSEGNRERLGFYGKLGLFYKFSLRNHVREMKCNVKSEGNEMCKKKCEGNVKIIGEKCEGNVKIMSENKKIKK